MASNNINNLQTKNTSFFPIALKYGIIGGVISIGFNLIFHLSIRMFWTMTMAITLLHYMLYIIIIARAIRTHRDKNMGGYIEMGSCIAVGMTTIMILSIVNVLWSIVLTKFIQPNIYGGQISIFDITKSTFIFMFFFGVLVSLIIGAVMKKNRPVTEL